MSEIRVDWETGDPYKQKSNQRKELYIRGHSQINSYHINVPTTYLPHTKMVTVVKFPAIKERSTGATSTVASVVSTNNAKTKAQASTSTSNESELEPESESESAEKLRTGPEPDNNDEVCNKNNNSNSNSNSNSQTSPGTDTSPGADPELLQIILEELETERAKRTKLEDEVANLKLQSHMQMQKEEDKKMKVMGMKKVSDARSVAVSALISALADEKDDDKGKGKGKSKGNDGTRSSSGDGAGTGVTKIATTSTSARTGTKIVSASLGENKQVETPVTTTNEPAPQDLPTSQSALPREDNDIDERNIRSDENAKGTTGISIGINTETSSNVNINTTSMSPLELQTTNEYPLHVAHKVHSLFSKRNSIPTWNMTATLQSFFQDLHTTILSPLSSSSCSSSMYTNSRGSSRGVKKIDMDKKKRIKAAIARVYAECNKESFSSRLIRTEYEEVLIKPILNQVALDFVKKLLSDYYQDEERDDKNVGGGAYSQTTTAAAAAATTSSSLVTNSGASHCHDKNHRLEMKQLRIERNGYLDLVDVLTSDNDAVQLSCKNAPGTLPLHATRFLEIMPWDDRSQDYISAHEKVIQWQCYDAKAQVWCDKLRLFPNAFGSLPIDKMEESSLDVGGGDGYGDPFYLGDDYGSDYAHLRSARTRTRTLSSTASTDSARSYGADPITASSSVQKIQNVFGSLALNILLTNASCTHILELSRGYPLPSRGVWEWCGNWHVEGSSNGTNFSSTSFDKDDGVSSNPEFSNFDNISKSVDTDDGWTYSNDLAELMCSDTIRYMSPEAKKKLKVYKRMYRKRVWQRQRVLIDYPGISQATKQMLQMNAHNAKLSIATSKLTAQVQNMQNTLTQKEEEAEKEKMQLMAQIAKLEKSLEEKTKKVEALSKNSNMKEHANTTDSTSSSDDGRGSPTVENIKNTPARIDLNDVLKQNVEIVPSVDKFIDHGISMNGPCDKHNIVTPQPEEGCSVTSTVESTTSISEKEEPDIQIQGQPQAPEQSTSQSPMMSSIHSDLPAFVGNWKAKRNRGNSFLETMKSNVQTASESILPKHLKIQK